jgi:hypothetical protein
MNLNTYRCGCGRIETLPHAKARPGPCMHGVRHENGPERGPMSLCAEWGGWKLYTQQVLDSTGAHTLWLAAKPRRDGHTWKGAPAADRKFEFIPPAFASVLAQADARHESRRQRGADAWGRIRMLARASIRQRSKRIAPEPIGNYRCVVRPVDALEPYQATDWRTAPNFETHARHGFAPGEIAKAGRHALSYKALQEFAQVAQAKDDRAVLGHFVWVDYLGWRLRWVCDYP